MKLLLLLFLVTHAWAEEEFKVYVNTFDGDIDTSSLDSSVVKTTQGAGENKSTVAALPHPGEMFKIFKSAGLEKEVEPLNQMDRDILYMKVAKRDLASVQKSYEQIPAEKLTSLKKLIEAQK